MNLTMVITLMILGHVIADFSIQKGFLCDAKQKKFWEENAPDPLYRFDWIPTMINHSLSWAIMVMLPIAYCYNWQPDEVFVVFLLGNTFIHAMIDDIKANRRYINLCVDQGLHLFQIIATALAFHVSYGVF